MPGRLNTDGPAENLSPRHAGALIFLMQAGFATLSAGSIRVKNVKNILLKNLLDACIGAIAWFLLGYGFAYHNAADGATNAFIGTGPSNFALSGLSHNHDQKDPTGSAPAPYRAQPEPRIG